MSGKEKFGDVAGSVAVDGTGSIKQRSSLSRQSRARSRKHSSSSAESTGQEAESRLVDQAEEEGQSGTQGGEGA